MNELAIRFDSREIGHVWFRGGHWYARPNGRARAKPFDTYEEAQSFVVQVYALAQEKANDRRGGLLENRRGSVTERGIAQGTR